MCAAEICEGSLVCVWLPFLTKCSCKFDSTVLSFMSVFVLGCAPKFSIKGGPTRPRTPLLGFAISKTTRDIFMQQLPRERS